MSVDHLFNIKRNQLKMIKNRGYNIDAEEWILDDNLTSHMFIKKLISIYGETAPNQYRNLLTSIYKHDENKKIIVSFVGIAEFSNKQISIDSIEKIIESMITNDTDCLIIINATLSSAANNRLNCITESKIQILNEDELLFNLIDHIFVPKYELLTKEEAAKLTSSLTFNKKVYPILLSSDPIYRYYNYNSGDIIKIYEEYNLLLSGQEYSYRIAA